MSDHENAVRISGTAEEAPLLRYTPKGSATTHFMLSSRRTVRPLSGPPWVETLRICVAAWHQVAVELAGGVRRGTFVTVEGYLALFDPKTASNSRARIAVVAQRVWIEPDARAPAPQRQTAAYSAEAASAAKAGSPKPQTAGRPTVQLPLEGMDKSTYGLNRST